MLKTAIRSVFRISRVSKRFGFALTQQPKFNFGVVEASSKLKQAVQNQIAHQEANIQDLSEYQNFFQNQGWTIKYHGIQVQLIKKNGPYNLRVLFNAKTPLPEEEQQQQEEEMQDQNPDYTDINVYINKQGTSKWLYCEFMITNKSDAHLGIATFINDYEADRVQKAKGRNNLSGYSGPELSSLEQNFQNGIYEFIEGVGINGETLQRAAEFSLTYEHQFYVEWLKDFRNLA